MLIDIEGRDTVVLDPHQGYTVPKQVEHRTRAPVRTAILMVEAAGCSRPETEAFDGAASRGRCARYPWSARALRGRRDGAGPGCYDALGARLIEEAGFPAAYMTGFGSAAARLAAPTSA